MKVYVFDLLAYSREVFMERRFARYGHIWPKPERPLWSAQRYQADIRHGNADGNRRPRAAIRSPSKPPIALDPIGRSVELALSTQCGHLCDQPMGSHACKMN